MSKGSLGGTDSTFRLKDQLRWASAKGVGQPCDRPQRRGVEAALDQSDVVTVQVRRFCELLLRQASCRPPFADNLAKRHLESAMSHHGRERRRLEPVALHNIVCNSRTDDRREEREMKRSGRTGIGLLVIVFSMMAGVSCSGTSSEQLLAREGCGKAKEFVALQLKAPSTAEYQPCTGQAFSVSTDDVFTFHGYVDAQNSFGAKIRTQYTARLHRLPDGQWVSDGVVMGP